MAASPFTIQGNNGSAWRVLAAAWPTRACKMLSRWFLDTHFGAKEQYRSFTNGTFPEG